MDVTASVGGGFNPRELLFVMHSLTQGGFIELFCAGVMLGSERDRESALEE